MNDESPAIPRATRRAVSDRQTKITNLPVAGGFQALAPASKVRGAIVNSSADEIDAILRQSQTIAVVGLSPRPDRPSYEVAAYLQRHGYRIIPVNPNATEVLGERAYPRLEDVPDRIDVVDVFRRPTEIGPIVDATIARRVPVLWLQLGVVNESEAARARAAGVRVIMDRCIAVEHRRRRAH